MKLYFSAKSRLLTELSFGLGFLTLKARLAVVKLRQIFIEVSIFYHYDLKYHIWVKIDALSCTIYDFLS